LRESVFIEQNEADWRSLEKLLKDPVRDADKLLQLFEKVSGDLAYARTYYPNRSIKVYLNNLTQEVLNLIHKKKKKFELNDILDFYRHTLPYEIYKTRKAFYTSFFVFVLAVVIGVVSSANVPDFCNMILGDDYMEMTEDNINDGDPMAVYKKMDQGSMFMMITINNIRVSFLCFVLGLLGSVGTIIVLISNGIMLGAFQYYFYSKGLFLTSFLTIWIHGTIEISAIIIAGAAGIILGNGLLFPRSYNRHASLIISAKRALKIILAIIPLFIIAGFLESFVTRLTELPMIVKILLIASSFLFILTIFVIYPVICARRGFVAENYEEIEPILIENKQTEKYKYTTFSEVISIAFAEMRIAFGPFLYHFLMPATIVITVVLFAIVKFKVLAEIGMPMDFNFGKFEYTSWPYALIMILLYSWLFIFLIMCSAGASLELGEKLKFIKKYFLKVFPLATIFVLGYFYLHNDFMWLVFLIIPAHFLFIVMEELSQDRPITFSLLWRNFIFSFKHWFSFVLISLVLIIFLVGVELLFQSSLASFVIDFLSWHDLLGNHYADKILIREILNFVSLTLPIPLVYFAYTYQYASLDSLVNATDLKLKFEKFGTATPLFEQSHA